MPFTISHAAAVLPLKRTRLPLAALMIGSMAPDFAYFLPMSMTRSSTHDLDGIFLFCLPVGLAVWLLFVHLLERPTIELLPAAWRDRVIPSDRRFSLKSLVLGALAVIVGACTHVLWDAFTHNNTFITNAVPALSSEVFEYRGRSIRVFFLLQILSSIIGLFALWLWALKLRRDQPRVRVPRPEDDFVTNRVRILALLSLLATSGLMALMAFVGSAGIPLEHRVFHLLVGGMTGWFLAWCVVAVLITRTARAARIVR